MKFITNILKKKHYGFHEFPDFLSEVPRFSYPDEPSLT